MALLENGLMKVGTGIAIGIGALILAPVVVPAVSTVVKPILKAGIKGGMMFFSQASQMLAEAAETIEDLVEEAKAEVMAEHGPSDSSPSTEGETTH